MLFQQNDRAPRSATYHKQAGSRSRSHNKPIEGIRRCEVCSIQVHRMICGLLGCDNLCLAASALAHLSACPVPTSGQLHLDCTLCCLALHLHQRLVCLHGPGLQIAVGTALVDDAPVFVQLHVVVVAHAAAVFVDACSAACASTIR